jgi:histidine triad (HIT) family protein
MRKIFIISSILFLSLIGVGFFLFPKAPLPTAHCAFCDSVVLNRQKFYEDDLVLALCTHKPILPGHCLIVSKRHVERFEMLTDEEIQRIGQVIKKVDQAVRKVLGTSSYLLLQKNGPEVGQSVPHMHIHYVPRQAGDTSPIQFLFKMGLANLKKPISSTEMNQMVERIREVLE